MAVGSVRYAPDDRGSVAGHEATPVGSSASSRSGTSFTRGTARRSSYLIVEDADVQISPLLSALFIVFAGLTLLRVAANPLLLDLVINYTSDSGAIVEKLHPSLYGFAGLAALALARFRITLTDWEVRVVRAMLAFTAVIVAILGFTAAVGRGGSAGFMIDTYVSACFAALLFLFPASWRRTVGHLLVAWLVLSALVAIAEFGLKTRLLPFSETEYAFRPIGLSNHPLDLGLWTATAIPFCAATAWSRRTKVTVCAILVVALGIIGARTALIVGLAGALIVAIGAIGLQVSARRRLERRIIVVIASLGIVPLLIVMLHAAGGLDRFQAGLADSNAQARVDVYRVFDHMDWGQFLLGMDPSAMRAIAKTYLKLEFIESSVVMFVGLFGALGSALFAVAFAWLMRVLLSGARPAVLLAVGVFFIVVLSSNGLSSKGSTIFLLFTLIIAFRPEPETARWTVHA